MNAPRSYPAKTYNGEALSAKRLTDAEVLDRIVYSGNVARDDSGVVGVESRMARELLRLRRALRAHMKRLDSVCCDGHTKAVSVEIVRDWAAQVAHALGRDP